MGSSFFTLIRNSPEINADKTLESVGTEEKDRAGPLVHYV